MGVIMEKIRNHYDCVNMDQSIFFEKYYPKTTFSDAVNLDPKYFNL